jgi:AcrR family transcriptional regulator
MGRRRSHVEETRRRITEAAVRLHTTVGPSETSFAAVAEAAGVTRLTLYRHFADRDELFAACMSHWRAAHPAPDSGAWSRIESFDVRLRRAVGELYAWYADNGEDLYPLYRDAAFTPPSTQRARRENIERMVSAILGSGRRAEATRPLRAAIGHVLAYWTWRSLVVDEGCTHRQAVELGVRFVLSSGHVPRAGLRGQG